LKININNRIYQTYSKGKPLFVKIEDVRWVLSDFWKKLSKRVTENADDEISFNSKLVE